MNEVITCCYIMDKDNPYDDIFSIDLSYFADKKTVKLECINNEEDLK